ncbi:uncharacterized protein DUF2617 [Haloactinospora alba]|uniref:Uncharacterized protein DUF2617 n=1 Tax=Haloactinospora alba TaxID=405555 RepID=A0A543NLS8_9ACTN|nr:DUF2617 family protein [Haloactinospora alba]TQN32795.1 uncharacterized protein DUF2617 [Haloactinospora alba]
MRTSLNAEFADTRASDLVWTLEEPELAPLAKLTVPLGACRAELRILGASHQVVLHRNGHTPLVETVACLPGREGELPPHVETTPAGAGTYTFTSEVAVLAWTEFTERVDRVRAAAGYDPHSVVASFPGNPYAVTTLTVQPPEEGQLRWRTWHGYPNTGELVTTTTVCAPDRAGRGRKEHPDRE